MYARTASRAELMGGTLSTTAIRTLPVIGGVRPAVASVGFGVACDEEALHFAFPHSKKRENLEAAVALHFAHYNLVRAHRSLKGRAWSIGELIEAA